MKNLLTFTGPNQAFDEKHAVLARIQIDNSLDLGWKKEDIAFITDFPFHYNGVSSVVIKTGIYYDFDLGASKVAVIAHLLREGLLDQRELYWSHDFDAYELNPIIEAELGLDDFDLGLTHYFYKPEWQCGSMFFKNSSSDIFQLLDSTIRAKPHASRNNEKTLTKLIKSKAIDNTRFRRLDVTYNVMAKCITTIYREALKPLRVIHFNPWYNDKIVSDKALRIFMYGQNRLRIPLMSPRLIKIFNYHGIK